MIEEKESYIIRIRNINAKMTMKITIQVGISMYKGGGDTKPLDDIKLFNESKYIYITKALTKIKKRRKKKKKKEKRNTTNH